MTKAESVARLEACGSALDALAKALRVARERFPGRDDLTLRLGAAEEGARALAGEIALRLRDLDESATPPDVAERLRQIRAAHPPALMPAPPADAPAPPRSWANGGDEEA